MSEAYSHDRVLVVAPYNLKLSSLFKVLEENNINIFGIHRKPADAVSRGMLPDLGVFCWVICGIVLTPLWSKLAASVATAVMEQRPDVVVYHTTMAEQLISYFTEGIDLSDEIRRSIARREAVTA